MAKGRKTGGRQKGVPNRVTLAAARRLLGSMELTPLDFMLQVMQMGRPEELTEAEWLKIRLAAASAAAPYVHPRLSSVEQTVTLRRSLKEYSEHELVAILAESQADSGGDSEPPESSSLTH